MTQKEPLRVLIVGGGIGGLAAALALRQAGHVVEVYEKSNMMSEVGAAVTLFPNSTTLLRHLGILPEDFRATRGTKMITRDFHDMSYRHETLFYSDDPERPSKDSTYFTQRVDLHQCLKQATTNPHGSGIPVTLHKGVPIASVDCEAASITLEDGRVALGDVVIGADGVHSKTRLTIFPNEHKPVSSGSACFRFQIPVEDLKSDPETAFLVEKESETIEVLGGDRRLILYQCGNGTMYNGVAISSRTNIGWNGTAFNILDKKGQLQKLFEGSAPSIQAMISKTTESRVTQWDLLDVGPLPLWTKGKFVLIGDAAHPLLPSLAQGASQAIEDGVCLSIMLPLGTTREQIKQRLNLFEQCRKARVDRIQQLSRWRGRAMAGTGPPPTPQEMREWIIYAATHNELLHSRKFFEAFA